MNKLATLTLFSAIALAQTACEMNIASKNNISGNQLMSNNPVGLGVPPATAGLPTTGMPVTAPVTPFKLASAPVQVPVGVLRLNDSPSTTAPQSVSTRDIAAHHDRIQSKLRDLNYDTAGTIQPASVDIFDRPPTTTTARAADLKPASTARAPASAPDPRPAPAPTPPQTALAQSSNPGASR